MVAVVVAVVVVIIIIIIIVVTVMVIVVVVVVAVMFLFCVQGPGTGLDGAHVQTTRAAMFSVDKPCGVHEEEGHPPSPLPPFPRSGAGLRCESGKAQHFVVADHVN